MGRTVSQGGRLPLPRSSTRPRRCRWPFRTPSTSSLPAGPTWTSTLTWRRRASSRFRFDVKRRAACPALVQTRCARRTSPRYREIESLRRGAGPLRSGRTWRLQIGAATGAAQGGFTAFQTGKAFTSSRIGFINLVIDQLTGHGVMDPSVLYESPFTGITPHGPDGLFGMAQIDQHCGMLEQVKSTAIAASA